jgi:hypothetical protein
LHDQIKDEIGAANGDMGEKRDVYTVLLGKPEGNRPIGTYALMVG